MFYFCWSLSLHTFCALVGFSAPRLTPRDGAEQGEPRSEEEQRAAQRVLLGAASPELAAAVAAEAEAFAQCTAGLRSWQYQVEELLG